MRFVLLSLIFLLPLVLTSPFRATEEFSLPSLEDVESHIDQLWTNFKAGFGIVYNTTAEEFHRFSIFTRHVKMILKHNLEHDLGLHTYRLGINRFAAMVYT